MTSVSPSGPGCQPSASAADASSQSGIPNADEQAWVNQIARVEAELDWIERDNACRQSFQPAMTRDQALRAVVQIYGLCSSRRQDFAAAYGWMGLWRILGIDFDRSKIEWLPASAIEARSDATGTGAAEGESAAPQEDARG